MNEREVMKKIMGTNIFYGEHDLKDQGVTHEVRGRWIPTRPIGYIGFWHTLKCAWMVLTNQADIVVWEYQ